MNLQEFITKWTDKECDWDGSFGSQCYDLYRFYCKEVLNVPQSPPTVGAVGIWDVYLKDYFERIGNTPDGIPLKGDIIIWGTGTGGGFGHVAIFIQGTASSFTSFDCNWPTGSLPHLQGHYYTNVLGWLHSKGGQVANMYNGLDLNNAESMKICVDSWKAVQDGKYVKKEDYDKKVEELLNEIKSKDTRIGEENKRYADLLVNLATKLGCTNEEPAIFEQITKLVGVEDQCTELQKTIEDLQKELEEAKKSGQITVNTTKCSKLCQFLAKIGL